ncbi:hypothetical protein CL656_06140 [bacterium]|nr:hypothetical protein [bacterium]|tara:strand:- start:1574 stop:1966 length:393 start_codon:yes stop_codon:yes gene_type:complete
MVKYIFLLFILIFYNCNAFKINNKFTKIYILKNNKYDYNFKLEYKINNDKEKKYCVDCKYHLPINNSSCFKNKYSKCKKYIKEDIDNDDIAMTYVNPKYEKMLLDNFEFCKDCRKNETKCGIEGKYFIIK